MAEVVFRFAVRSTDNRRSGTWKVWTPPNSSDVYIAGREMKGDLKISLHASGEFQVSFTKEYEKLLQNYGAWSASRHIEKWSVKRPVKGSVLAIRVYVPETELRQMKEKSGRNECIHWVPAPSEGQTAVFEVVLAEEDLQFTGSGCPQMLTQWVLPTKEAVWIGHYVAPTPDAVNEALSEFQSRRGMRLDAREDWDPNFSDGRILIFGPNAGGWQSFIDAAAAPILR